jgi:hypothetical protein
MAITVEDGTGLATADAYISEADADTYFAAIGNTTWSGASSGDKEQAIVKATRYMEKRFGNKWKGIIASSTQALGWPRDYVYDKRGTELDDQVPTAIAHACAEYALHALSNELIPSVIYPVADGAPVPFGRINRKVEKVGPVYEETYYSTGGASASRVSSGSALVDADRVVQYPEADFLVGPFLRSTKGVSR